MAAYDSSKDEAGDPPRREPVRRRLAIVEAAKHYKVSQSNTRKIIMIVDANLARLGLEKGCGKRGWHADRWTAADDKLLLTSMRDQMSGHKYYGRARLPVGFWRELKLSTFPDRTESALYQRWKELQGSDDGQVQKPPDWTSEEEEKVIRAVQTERGSNKGKIRPGFWPKLLQDEFPDRSLAAIKKRLVVIEKKIGPIGSTQAVQFSQVDDDEILRVVSKEREKSQTGRVKRGFWLRLQQNRFRDKTPQDLQNRYVKVRNERRYGRADGRRFSVEEDAKLMDLLIVNGVSFGKAPKGFWNDIQKHFPDRTPHQLYDRWSWKKKQRREARAESLKTAATELSCVLVGDVPKFFALSPQEALQAKYPPGTSVSYRPSSSDAASAAKPGRVMKVEMRTNDQANIDGRSYLYTIFDDDNGNRYERVPEFLLEWRD